MTATTTAHRLTLSDGTSRARESFGYRIVRLRDSRTRRVFSCKGGGYDMVGTVLGLWLTATHQDDLRALARRAFYRHTPDATVRTDDERSALYGLAVTMDEDGTVTRVSIDGACGVASVERVAEAAGVKLAALPGKPGAYASIGGWTVQD